MAIYVNNKKVAGFGGRQGPPGMSAYQLAVQNGFDRAEEEWLASLKGPPGPAGADGKTPYIGSNGNWWIGTEDTGISASGSTSPEGVTSFNGRSGAVLPQSGDYTAAMVGAIPASQVQAIQALTQADYDALGTKNAGTLYLVKE